jgi:hypothetical protein
MPPVALAKSGGKKGKLRGITQVAGATPRNLGTRLACMRGKAPHFLEVRYMQ